MIRKKRESLFEFSSKNIDLSIYYRHKIQTFKQIDGTITRRILKIYHSISSNPRMLSRLIQGSQTLDRFDPETLLLLLLLRCIVDSLREQIRDILDRSHENYLFFQKSETRLEREIEGATYGCSFFERQERRDEEHHDVKLPPISKDRVRYRRFPSLDI